MMILRLNSIHYLIMKIPWQKKALEKMNEKLPLIFNVILKFIKNVQQTQIFLVINTTHLSGNCLDCRINLQNNDTI